jgi:choline-sulfatase
MKASDAYLVQLLDTLEEQGLLENTLIIYTSDHGEMGMTHGGMIQKNFNAYEETLRVPLVFSNPTLFPEPRTSEALVSHVDFLPTIASLFDATPSSTPAWQGRDYSSLLLDPDAEGVQDYTIFTYDDFQSGQRQGPYPTGANHIVSIRDARYTFARYYDPTGEAADQYEMYDRQEDPNQMTNLAWTNVQRTSEQEDAYQRLRALLEEVEGTRLQPLG